MENRSIMIPTLVLLLLHAEATQASGTNTEETQGRQSSLASLFSCCIRPRMCKTPTGEKIEPGDTYVTDTGVWLCQRNKRKVALVPQSCIRNGTVIEIGKIRSFGNYFFKCKRVKKLFSEGIGLEKIACKSESGSFKRPGEEFELGNYVYLCDLKEGNLARVKCYQDGQYYEVGEVWNYKHRAHNCTKKDTYFPIQLVSIGCVNDKKELITEDDEWFIADELQWRCKITDEGYYPKVVGCAPKDFYTRVPEPHSLGQTWYLRNGNEIDLGYIQTCISTDDGIEIKVIECVYRISSQVKKYILPGCAALIGDKAFTCGEEGGKTVVKLTPLKRGVKFAQFVEDKQLQICDIRNLPSVSSYIDETD